MNIYSTSLAIVFRKVLELKIQYSGRIKKNEQLWNDLNAYLEKTGSTGCSLIDYEFMYNYILKNKPREILECGTGASTIVIAHALKVNNNNGFLSSMESVERYYDMAMELLPDHLKDSVEIILSPEVEDYFCMFRGVRYKDVPKREYELVFIDGPGTTAPSDNSKTFNFDFINIVKSMKTPVAAIIDRRNPTVWVFQNIFGKKAKYNAITHIGTVDPVTQKDIKKWTPKTEQWLSVNSA